MVQEFINVLLELLTIVRCILYESCYVLRFSEFVILPRSWDPAFIHMMYHYAMRLSEDRILRENGWALQEILGALDESGGTLNEFIGALYKSG